jgi:hypothetical protein
VQAGAATRPGPDPAQARPDVRPDQRPDQRPEPGEQQRYERPEPREEQRHEQRPEPRYDGVPVGEQRREQAPRVVELPADGRRRPGFLDDDDLDVPDFVKPGM